MSTTSLPISTRRSRRRSGTALALWLGVATFLTLGAFASRAEGGEADRDILYEPAFAATAAVFYGLLLAASFGIARLYPRPANALGFRPFRRRWLWISFAVVFGTLVVARLLEPVLHGGEEQGFAPERWQPEHAAAFALNCVILILVGPFAEEVFFRGLGVRVLAPFGGLVAIVGSGIVFGLVHGVLGALPPLILFGIGLAWIRLRSASVWPGFVAHATFNGLGIGLLLLAWAIDQPVS